MQWREEDDLASEIYISTLIDEILNNLEALILHTFGLRGGALRTHIALQARQK